MISGAAPRAPSLREVFTDRRLAFVLLMGFASGLPLALSGGTLQAWLAVEGVNLRTLGLTTLIALPYSLKFLWAPLMDRFVPPLLGRRRGWIVLCQGVCALLIGLMAALDAGAGALRLAAVAALLAFVSASQDVVIDAWRAEVLPAVERGLGAAGSVLGYRLAMLVSGAGALILSAWAGWRETYGLMALLMLLMIPVTLMAPEPDQPAEPGSLADVIGGALKDLLSRRAALGLLLLVVLYKLGDAFALSLATPFLIQTLHFSAAEVGAVNKGFGLAATLAGAILGGALMVRLGLYRSLLLFGAAQAFTILAFLLLAVQGKSYGLLILAVGLENLGSGMGTSALVALLMALCTAGFSATQFALLSALASLGRILCGPPAAALQLELGWEGFFFACFLIALPGLATLMLLRRHIPETAAAT